MTHTQENGGLPPIIPNPDEAVGEGVEQTQTPETQMPDSPDKGIWKDLTSQEIEAEMEKLRRVKLAELIPETQIPPESQETSIEK